MVGRSTRWHRTDPQRSLLILKAWMLCRARAHPGWIESNMARQRLFTEEADVLLDALKRLQPQADGVLGNAVASRVMRVFVSDIVTNIWAELVSRTLLNISSAIM